MPHISAFILAAGEGRRLRPSTLVRPKALVPFCGVPMLELTASSLSALDIDNIVVNAFYQGDRVYEFCQRIAAAHGWNIKVSQEHALLNHGGGLRYGVRLIPEAEHILVHNVDVVMDFDLRQLLKAHLDSQADVTALLIPNRGARTVSINDDGSIRNFRDKENGKYTLSGIHILKRGILDLLNKDEEAPSIIDCYQKAMAMGKKVVSFIAPDNCYWTDIGTPADYIRAHGEIADCALTHHPMLRQAQAEQAVRRFALENRGVICTGALGLGKELGVPAGAQLHNVILWDYTRLPRPLLYADGIFTGDDVQAPPAVTEQRMPDRRLLDCIGITSDMQYSLTPLAKQGSGRRYSRISSEGKSWVWSAYNPERRENSSFAAICDFLKRLGIRVPGVLHHLPDTCEMITEDLGQSDLQLTAGPLREKYLLEAVEQIARLHVLGDQAVRLEELPLQKGFTKGLYDWERDYFRNNMLDRCLHAPALWTDAAAEFCQIRSTLLRQPLVPIHRDLQSANIKIHEGHVWLIDFQGMRLGCAAYDLASLLYDPYQCHPADLRNEVWAEYKQQVIKLGGMPPEDAILRLAACQRLMQALGAYGKLWLQDGLDWYRQFIIPGLTMFNQATSEIQDKFPAFHRLAAQALDLAVSRLK